MKLLIAEDDLTSRTILEAVAIKWGYQPTVVEDGEQAWVALHKSNAPQLLLIDWEMPNLNGLELCKRIREQTTANPPYIILLTARNNTEDIVKGLEVGANDYIPKPFDNAELKARLKVGERMLELQNEVMIAQDMLAYERTVIEGILLKMHEAEPFNNTNLRKLEVPVEATSGDMLLAATRPDGTRHIMLGDFTGHGLISAIGAPLVSDIFYAMTSKALGGEPILEEINNRLSDKLPVGLFLGVIFMSLNPKTLCLTLWNCGMSDILIYRDTMLIEKIPSNTIALGIIKQPINATHVIQLQRGDRIYAYSDGITEASNSNGEEFGESRLELAITELIATNSDIKFLTAAVNHFRGKTDQSDDITLVEITC